MEQVLRERYHDWDSFRAMKPEEKAAIRSMAVENIRQRAQGRVVLVAGHATFFKGCKGGSRVFESVFSDQDALTYNAIVYLKISAEIVSKQRANDASTGQRLRPNMTESDLQAWMSYEEAVLQQSCKKHDIPLHIWSLSRGENTVKENDDHDPHHETLESLIRDEFVANFIARAHETSTQALLSAINSIPNADTYMLIDGDRTMWPGDTGKLFLGDLSLQQKSIFQRYKTYNIRAFFESAMLFATYPTYEERCDALAREIRLYDSLSSFCRSLPSNVCPVLVTAGVREIWAKALSAAGLGKMSVIAGNHSTLHNYIISDEAKGLVARELRRLHPGCQILSFGDSGKSTVPNTQD